jgi:hypothetical protein
VGVGGRQLVSGEQASDVAPERGNRRVRLPSIPRGCREPDPLYVPMKG